MIAWFEWAKKQRIVIAMSAEVAYTAEGKAVSPILSSACCDR
ncbi:MAG: hypothetical protein V7L11_25470 [Nostoc sp.]